MVEPDFPQSSPARNTAKRSFAIFTQNQPVLGLNHIFNPLNRKIMELILEATEDIRPSQRSNSLASPITMVAQMV